MLLLNYKVILIPASSLFCFNKNLPIGRLQILQIKYHTSNSRGYSGPYQKSAMKLFAKIARGEKPLTILEKNATTDVC